MKRHTYQVYDIPDTLKYHRVGNKIRISNTFFRNRYKSMVDRRISGDCDIDWGEGYFTKKLWRYFYNCKQINFIRTGKVSVKRYNGHTGDFRGNMIRHKDVRDKAFELKNKSI